MKLEDALGILLDEKKNVEIIENLFIEAVKDLIKDEIKKRIREVMEDNPRIKKEIENAINMYAECKVKEAYALAKIMKCGLKVGLSTLPERVRREMQEEISKIIEEGLSEILPP